MCESIRTLKTADKYSIMYMCAISMSAVYTHCEFGFILSHFQFIHQSTVCVYPHFKNTIVQQCSLETFHGSATILFRVLLKEISLRWLSGSPILAKLVSLVCSIGFRGVLGTCQLV